LTISQCQPCQRCDRARRASRASARRATVQAVPVLTNQSPQNRTTARLSCNFEAVPAVPAVPARRSPRVDRTAANFGVLLVENPSKFGRHQSLPCFCRRP